MASEMRRIAASLVATRTVRFESRYGAEESRERVTNALAACGSPRTMRMAIDWIDTAHHARLEMRFSPGARTHTFLKLISLVLLLGVVASAWLMVSDEQSTPMRFLVPLMTVLGILGFPLGVYEGYFREHKYGLATQTFGPWMGELQDMQEELEQLFARPVDFVQRSSVERSENYLRRRSILSNLVPLYVA